VPKATHFFEGQEEELIQVIKQFIDRTFQE
jgi:alpha/beta superfamily hydrolase